MTKYYRVIKENPLWEVGAIIESSNSNGYLPVEDVWNLHKDQTEYLSDDIVEDSPDFFERVYRSEADKMLFKTADELKKIYGKFFPDKVAK